MKTKIIIFILLLTVVASVYFFYKFIPKKNPSFVFENKTEFLLDSITFSTSKSCIYKKIFNIRPKSNFQDNFFFSRLLLFQSVMYSIASGTEFYVCKSLTEQRY
jgi:hypothetical protein